MTGVSRNERSDPSRSGRPTAMQAPAATTARSPCSTTGESGRTHHTAVIETMQTATSSAFTARLATVGAASRAPSARSRSISNAMSEPSRNAGM